MKKMMVGILSILLLSGLCSGITVETNNQTVNETSSNIMIPNINYTKIDYNEELYIVVKNNTAYVKDVLNGTGIDAYHVKSAGIILYDDVYVYNYSNLKYGNSSNKLSFYYNFSLCKTNNSINITVPQLEDYVGPLGGSVRMRIPPRDVKVMILVEDKLVETNGNYVLRYNKTDKKVVSLVYMNNISSICKTYNRNSFNSSNFYGYSISNITSIDENKSHYIIKNSKGTFPFEKKYDIIISNNTAYLKEPYLYVKIYNSTPDDVLLMDNNEINKNNGNNYYGYVLLFISIVVGFGLIALAIYLKRGDK